MAIIGVDNRVAVTNTAASIYKAVVEVDVVFPDGSALRASGAMIGRNTVLTAGHVVYDAGHGGYASIVVVTAAENGPNVQPYGAALGTRWVAAPGWISGGSFSFDNAVISLDRAIGDTAGWYNYVSGASADAYAGAAVSTAGYPGDKGYATMWSEHGTVDLSTAHTLDFTSNLDVYYGQSGSPIFITGSDGHPSIIGVVSNSNGLRNEAIRIAPEFAAIIAQQIAANPPPALWPTSSADAGNNLATAAVFALPAGLSGTVGNNTDPGDWFKFTADDNGTATWTIRGLGNDLDLVLADAEGNVLATSSHAGIVDESISWTVTAGATYVLEVVPAAGLHSGYTLIGTVTPAAAITGTGAAGEIVNGTAGNDVIVTGDGDNSIRAGAGDDRIIVGNGSKTIDGGPGYDLAAILGQISQYNVSVDAASGTVKLQADLNSVATLSTGGDTLTNIEFLQFSDKTLFLLHAEDAELARLYSSAFGRIPDIPGFEVQAHAAAAGLSAQAIAANFIAGTEGQSLFAGTDDRAFAASLYHTALGRDPDAGGLQFWLDYLGAGYSRSDMLLGFAASAEQQARTASWLYVLG
jgi:V8-like Glu-specific endopeptidase